MNEPIHIDSRELFLEITRYLAAVDLYRAESCEPTWLPESAPLLVTDVSPQRPRTEPTPSAH